MTLLLVAILIAVITFLASAIINSRKIPKPPDTKSGEWVNWACNQKAQPTLITMPETIEELKAIVTLSETGVRAVGAGHSFTELVNTTETIISLDKLSTDPVISVDTARKTAWVKAGARLKDLSPALARHGLAFKNLGDINVQSLAGATATATHGTGESFPCLSAEIRGIKILKADGNIITSTIEDNPDLLHATQVSLGTLGILLEAELNLTDKYFLHRNAWIEPLLNVLDFAEEKWRKHRNFEFYYLPYSNHCACITHDEIPEQEPVTVANQDTEVLMSLKMLRDFFSWAPSLRRSLLQLAMKSVKPEEEIEESWKLLASVRDVRFTEMEYHLPIDTGLLALQKVITYIENNRRDAFFPIEVRKTAADQAWLSPFQGAPRISVAVHAFYKEDISYFKDEIEKIFLQHGGRPHWGKLHSLTAAELNEMYPDFSRFQELRKQMDPEGKFLTPYLKTLLGI